LLCYRYFKHLAKNKTQTHHLFQTPFFFHLLFPPNFLPLSYISKSKPLCSTSSFNLQSIKSRPRSSNLVQSQIDKAGNRTGSCTLDLLQPNIQNQNHTPPISSSKLKLYYLIKVEHQSRNRLLISTLASRSFSTWSQNCSPSPHQGETFFLFHLCIADETLWFMGNNCYYWLSF